jgi:autotransporter-associated beta strand protein
VDNIKPTGGQANAAAPGIAQLLASFIYGTPEGYTIRLTGLQPSTAHDFRFYFRNYGTVGFARNVAFTFSVGGNIVGSVTHNLDGSSRSQARCVYMTDGAGTLDVHVRSLNPDSCHLYAFSNETLGGTLDAPDAAVLTVAPPAGVEASFDGSLTGHGALVKAGNGTQRFGGKISLDGGFAVQAGTVVLEPGIGSAGTPEVAAGATLAVPHGAVTLEGLSGNGTLNIEGTGGFMPNKVYITPFTNDATSQIAPDKIYTHKLDFGTRGSVGALVNNVQFDKASNNGSVGNFGWSGFQTGAHGGAAGNPPNPIGTDQGMYNRLWDFVNSNNNPTDPPIVATLSGLTVGKQYELRFYNRAWGTAGGGNPRYQTVTFMPDSATPEVVHFNPDGHTPHILGYRYTATSGALTLHIYGLLSNQSWHIYALSNEEYDGRDDDVNLGAGVTLGANYAPTYPDATLYLHYFTDDATSKISAGKRYTHKLDFGTRDGISHGKPGVTVNDVQFVKAGNRGMMDGYGWSGFSTGAHGGGNEGHIGIPNNQATYHLLRDFAFGQATGTAQLTGLTPGKQYEVRIYLRAWTVNDGRPVTLTFIADPAAPETISFMSDGIPTRFVAYRYTPTSTTLTIPFVSTSAQSWHIYALTNEEVYDQTDSPMVFDTTDDSTFDGTVTGEGIWVKRGDGALTLTGNNTVTGPLTIAGGALGAGAGGVATLGPVSVLDDAMLFGQGTVGGAVNVASNAWLQGGTMDACGVLTIGGNLTLAEGAKVKFRFATTSLADAFVVNGVLTLPQDGVVFAEPIKAGAKSPVKWLLFSSPNAEIKGPANLSGWVIDGIPTAKLSYGIGNRTIYLDDPRGTVLLVR